MTINEFLKVAVCEKVDVVCNGLIRELDQRDPLMMVAYGNFVVDKVQFFRDHETEESVYAEITVLMRPVVN